MDFEKPLAGGRPHGWIRNSPKWARLHLCCRQRNRGKGVPQATHTGAPCENCRQLPSAGISSVVFFVYASLTSSANKETKTSSRNRMLIQFYIPQWMVDNIITNNMVTPCQKKRATFYYVIYRSIYKNCARCGSVLRSTCVLLKLELFST